MANLCFDILATVYQWWLLWFHNPDHLDTLSNSKVLSYTLNEENAAMKFMRLSHREG